MTLPKLQLDELINKVEDIPAFPQTVVKIMDLLAEPHSKIVDIEREIMKDQALTTKVLKMANSSFYRGRRQIKTVADAMVLLGFDAVNALVIASTVGSVMNKELKGYSYGRNELWYQSQVSAIMAQETAKKAKFKNQELAYIAGLLKDIGKIILDEYVHDSYQEIMEKMNTEYISYIASEEEVLGFHHGQVGGKVISKWNLADELVEAITYHHDPLQATMNKELVCIIHISDALFMMLGLHEGIDNLSQPFFTEAVKILGLTEEDLENILEKVRKTMDEQNIYID